MRQLYALTPSRAARNANRSGIAFILLSYCAGRFARSLFIPSDQPRPRYDPTGYAPPLHSLHCARRPYALPITSRIRPPRLRFAGGVPVFYALASAALRGYAAEALNPPPLRGSRSLAPRRRASACVVAPLTRR